MKAIAHTKLIASMFLLIFSASVFAVCPCNHHEGQPVEVKRCCCKKAVTTHSGNLKRTNQQGCRCEKRIVKFNKLEKQLTQQSDIKQNISPYIYTIQFNWHEYIANRLVAIAPLTAANESSGHHPPEYYIRYHALRI